MKPLTWILLLFGLGNLSVHALPVGPCESAAQAKRSPGEPISAELRTQFLAIKADFGPDEIRIVTDRERQVVDQFEALTSGPEWFAPGVGKFPNAREAFESFFHGGNFGGLNGRTVAILTTTEVDASGAIVPFQPKSADPSQAVQKQIRVVSGYVEDVTPQMMTNGWLIKVITAEGQNVVPLHAVRRLRVKHYDSFDPLVSVQPDFPFSILPEQKGLRTAVDEDDLNHIAASTWELFQANLIKFNQVSTRYHWSPTSEVAKGQIIAAIELFEYGNRVVGLQLVVGEVTGFVPYSSGKIGFANKEDQPSSGVSIFLRGQDGKNRQIPVAMLQKLHRLTVNPAAKN